MTEPGRWIEQWKRIERWRQRVDGHNGLLDNNTVDVSSPEWLTKTDDVHALFQAIWHLKDWLANDDDVPIDKAVAERMAWSTETLRTVGDIACATKHARLDTRKADPGRPVRTAKSHPRRQVLIHAKESAGSNVAKVTGVGMRWVYGTGQGTLALAEQAIDEWRQMLTAKGLLPADAP